LRKASTAGFAALLVFAASPAAAEHPRVKACFNLRSNAEQRDCLHELYRAASAELDDILRRKLEAADATDTAPPMIGAAPQTLGLRDAIAASQKAWEAYREVECWGVVGRPGGSGRLGWAYGCLAEKTLARIDEVKVPCDQR
jgi:uncharacterized protein YecT (DUF1311 family)